MNEQSKPYEPHDFMIDIPEVDIVNIKAQIKDGNYDDAWGMLPEVVRQTLIRQAPFGEPWDQRLDAVLNNLTEKGSISIIYPDVTKDSDRH